MEDLELSEIIGSIKKRKFILFLFIMVSLIITSIYLLKAPPIYKATTKILIESKPPKTISLEDILVQDYQDEEFFKTQYSLFQSRSLIKRLLIKLDLLESKEFNTPPLFDFSGVKKWTLSILVAIGLMQEKEQANDQTDPYSLLIDRFLDRLEVAPVKDSKIVRVEFQGYSPLLTAQITNTLVDLYISSQVDHQMNLEAGAEEWLKSQGKELSKWLKQSNQKVQNFIQRKNMVELDDKRDFTNQQYRETLTETNKVQTEIIKLKSMIQQVESLTESPEQLFNSIPESLKDETISELRTLYLNEVIKQEYLSKNLKPSHPDRINSLQEMRAIEARIPQEMNRFLKSLKADLRAIQKQEQELRSIQQQQKANLMDLDKKTIRFKQIEEEAESNKKLLDQLLTRGKELGVYSSYYVPPVRIVDRAEVPIRPFKPQKIKFLVLALSFGIFGGLILVFFLESVDTTIKNDDDVKSQLPYRLLGSLEQYGKNGFFSSSKENAYKFRREFQNLRTNFLPLLTNKSTKVFLVTSSFPGEGKSTVTSHLAISLGEVGKKVLIIDADLEHPKIHLKFDTQKTPGIVNILSNSKNIKQILIKTKYSGVWVISAGEFSGIPQSSPDVLFSLPLPSLLDGLKNTFDVIFIKTAPVLSGPHTRIIEKCCDGILFVMASGKSSKKITRDIIDQLASTPVDIKKRQFLNGEEGKVPSLPGETNSSQKTLRIILTKVKDKKEEKFGYKLDKQQEKTWDQFYAS